MSRGRGPTGAHRAAAFLLSLEKEDAASVLRQIDEKLVVQVVEAMGDLDPSLTDPESVRRLYFDLAQHVHVPEGVRSKDEVELRRMLEETFDAEEAQAVLDRMRDRRLQERPFLTIEYEPAANIAMALEDESEAVIAAVLAHLSPGLSAEVLASFEEERALSIVRRMAGLIPPNIDTLRSIATELSERLERIAEGPVAPDRTERLKTIAEILNYSEPGIEKSVLEGIDEDDAEMANEIRDHMFTWDELATVDRRAMQKILASVDTRTLSLALKGCDAQVEQNITGNLSSRVRAMVEEERDLAGAIPMSEVQRSREEIMKAVQALIASGEYSPVRAGEDLVS